MLGLKLYCSMLVKGAPGLQLSSYWPLIVPHLIEQSPVIEQAILSKQANLRDWIAVTSLIILLKLN